MLANAIGSPVSASVTFPWRINCPKETDVQRKKKPTNKNRSISREADRSIEAAKLNDIFEHLLIT